MKFRKSDRWGSGEYRAKRGSRLHNGADVCHSPGEPVLAVSGGSVTKIGYPYSQGPDAHPDKKALRYVQITDSCGLHCRYFYVIPGVKVGDHVRQGASIGIASGLGHIYNEITEHYHFEVLAMVRGSKVFSDPVQYLRAVGCLS